MKESNEQIYYINKKKSELSSLEKFLVKNNKEKFKRVKKNKDKISSEERLRKRTKQIEKQRRKEEKELWKTVDEFKKNPKKFNNKMSKKERQILKFFNEKNKEEPKGRKAKSIKRIKEYSKTSLVAYFQAKELLKIWDEIDMASSYHINPNKQFVKRTVDSRTYDAKEVALLKTLEEEIMDRLLEDPLDPLNAFQPNNIVVEYNDKMKEKKHNKKRKKLDINKLII